MLAIDDVKASVQTAAMVQKHFPHLVIFARARNRQHAYELKAMGIHNLFRETFVTSLEMTQAVLQQLGLPFSEAHRTMEIFRAADERLLDESFHMRGDVESLSKAAFQARADLEKLFEADARALSDDGAEQQKAS